MRMSRFWPPRFFKRKESHRKKEEISLIDLEEKRRAIKKHLLIYGYIFFFSLFVIFIIWFGLKSPFVRWSSIEISGNKQVSDRDVLTLIESRLFKESQFRYLLGYRHLYVWPDELTEEELRPLPLIKSLILDKSYLTRKIFIKVVERKPAGVWCFEKYVEATRCYWYDEEGRTILKAPFVGGSLITRISDESQDATPIFNFVLPKEVLPNLFSIIKALERSSARVEDIRIKKLEMKEIEVKLKEGPLIYFSLRFSADKTAPVIESLTKNGGEKMRAYQYIDFRVENRAYYK